MLASLPLHTLGGIVSFVEQRSRLALCAASRRLRVAVAEERLWLLRCPLPAAAVLAEEAVGRARAAKVAMQRYTTSGLAELVRGRAGAAMDSASTGARARTLLALRELDRLVYALTYDSGVERHPGADPEAVLAVLRGLSGSHLRQMLRMHPWRWTPTPEDAQLREYLEGVADNRPSHAPPPPAVVPLPPEREAAELALLRRMLNVLGVTRTATLTLSGPMDAGHTERVEEMRLAFRFEGEKDRGTARHGIVIRRTTDMWLNAGVHNRTLDSEPDELEVTLYSTLLRDTPLPRQRGPSDTCSRDPTFQGVPVLQCVARFMVPGINPRPACIYDRGGLERWVRDAMGACGLADSSVAPLRAVQLLLELLFRVTVVGELDRWHVLMRTVWEALDEEHSEGEEGEG